MFFYQYEVQPTGHMPDNDGGVYVSSFETEEEAKDAVDAEGGEVMWSVYGRSLDGTVTWLSDHKEYRDAALLVENITGKKLPEKSDSKVIVTSPELVSGVFKYLDCSTAHVSQETMRFLGRVYSRNNIGQTVAAYEYGCFVSVPPEPTYHDYLPQDLRNVLDFARANGCYILRLDADGHNYDELPTFEW